MYKNIEEIYDKLTNSKIELKHSLDVALLCRKMGQKLGLSTQAVDELYLAGKYHDIGKAMLPESILKNLKNLQVKNLK